MYISHAFTSLRHAGDAWSWSYELEHTVVEIPHLAGIHPNSMTVAGFFRRSMPPGKRRGTNVSVFFTSVILNYCQ